MAWLLASLLPCSAADWFKWDAQQDRVDAMIETWTVPQVLGRVATSTGWEIFVDPEITNTVPAKFHNKPQGEALRQLLRDYNYALVPSTNGLSKFFVFRTSRAQATRAVEAIAFSSKPATNRIGNELIVTLKPGEKIEDVAKRLGAKIVGRSDEQNTYRLRFDDEKTADAARAAAANDPAVESVDSNYYVSRPEMPQPTGGPGGPLALIPKASPDGQYTVVGLIDSAVQVKDGNFADFILPGASVGEATSENGPSHGTSMAELILRGLSAASEDKSTGVRLLPVNVFGENETTTTYDIAKGVYQAVNGGAMIVNMSMGGDGDSSFLYKTIKSAYDQGVVFIAAAGNEPVTTPTYPAAYSEVIAVTASDRTGSLASYANRGNFVDAIAPGGGTVTYKGRQYYIVGTSTSTAYASGIAAAIAERTRQTGRPVENSLRQTLAPNQSPR